MRRKAKAKKMAGAKNKNEKRAMVRITVVVEVFFVRQAQKYVFGCFRFREQVSVLSTARLGTHFLFHCCMIPVGEEECGPGRNGSGTGERDGWGGPRF